MNSIIKPDATQQATYLPVKCFVCGRKDAIRGDYYRPRRRVLVRRMRRGNLI